MSDLLVEVVRDDADPGQPQPIRTYTLQVFRLGDGSFRVFGQRTDTDNPAFDKTVTADVAAAATVEMVAQLIGNVGYDLGCAPQMIRHAKADLMLVSG